MFRQPLPGWRSLFQPADAGFEIPAAAGRVFFFLLGAPEPHVVEVGSAVAAFDDVEMELDVAALDVVQHAEEVSAERAAIGTGDATALPDGPERVVAEVAAADQLGEPFEERRIIAQRLLDRGRLFGREGFIEKGFEDAIGKRHAESGRWSGGRLWTGVRFPGSYALARRHQPAGNGCVNGTGRFASGFPAVYTGTRLREAASRLE